MIAMSFSVGALICWAILQMSGQASQESAWLQIAHYVIAGIGAVMTKIIHGAAKEIRQLRTEFTHTRVKANLAFNYAVRHQPDLKDMYDAAINRNGESKVI